jgi:hypothetical protein
MFGDFSKRTILLFVVGAIAATAITVELTYFVLQTFVMDRPDPLYSRGGLKPNQQIK